MSGGKPEGAEGGARRRSKKHRKTKEGREGPRRARQWETGRDRGIVRVRKRDL